MDSPIAPDARVSYDPKCDAMYIAWNSEAIDVSIEVANGIVIDLNEAGEPVGIEILDASRVFSDVVRQAAAARPTKAKA